MNKIYTNHKEWEDANSGMYDCPSSTDDPLKVSLSAELLANAPRFFNAAMEMVDTWTVSAKTNLSNRSRNRQAWIGQATCCYVFGAKEHQVKEAWHTLTKKQQDDANEAADEVISIWEKYNA